MAKELYKFFDDKKGVVEITPDMRESIIGKSIIKIKTLNETEEGHLYSQLILVLNDGTELIIDSNQGCGGCYNGWFEYDINKVITLGLEGNVITNVNVNCDVTDDGNDASGTFTVQIFSIDKRYDIDFNGQDNGYYGIGISLEVKMLDSLEEH